LALLPLCTIGSKAGAHESVALRVLEPDGAIDQDGNNWLMLSGWLALE
jgi:hypothetical protein